MRNVSFDTNALSTLLKAEKGLTKDIRVLIPLLSALEMVNGDSPGIWTGAKALLKFSMETPSFDWIGDLPTVCRNENASNRKRRFSSDPFALRGKDLSVFRSFLEAPIPSHIDDFLVKDYTHKKDSEMAEGAPSLFEDEEAFQLFTAAVHADPWTETPSFVFEVLGIPSSVVQKIKARPSNFPCSSLGAFLLGQHLFETAFSALPSHLNNARRWFRKPDSNNWIDARIASVCATSDLFVTEDKRLRERVNRASLLLKLKVKAVEFSEFEAMI